MIIIVIIGRKNESQAILIDINGEKSTEEYRIWRKGSVETRSCSIFKDTETNKVHCNTSSSCVETRCSHNERRLHWEKISASLTIME